jgi:exodeoxyribonuclease V beta subunit
MRERFSELEFDLYAGEPAPGRELLTERRLIEALGILCRAHRADPGYAPEYLAPGAIRGIVKGFIDLFFFARGRYWVIDWKSNRVSGSARGYTQSALAAEMQRHGYRLQYLIYLVAAMRFLKARLGPETDVYGRLGGALYLFIRGVRPDAPGQGVVFDRPRRAVLECLDDLFSRGWSREVVEAYAARVREEESHD